MVRWFFFSENNHTTKVKLLISRSWDMLRWYYKSDTSWNDRWFACGSRGWQGYRLWVIIKWLRHDNWVGWDIIMADKNAYGSQYKYRLMYASMWPFCLFPHQLFTIPCIHIRLREILHKQIQSLVMHELIPYVRINRFETSIKTKLWLEVITALVSQQKWLSCNW